MTNSRILNHVLNYEGSEQFSTTHAVQVSRISLKLFDALQPLHRMGNTERLWLKTAALFHDIGKIYGNKMHHKSARKIIHDMPGLPFRKKERLIIAIVARYHRGKFPDMSQKDFRNLDKDARKYVLRLAALLRLADGFCDKSCDSPEGFSLLLGRKKVAVFFKKKFHLNLDKAARKAKLFEQVFNRKIVIDLCFTGN